MGDNAALLLLADLQIKFGLDSSQSSLGLNSVVLSSNSIPSVGAAVVDGSDDDLVVDLDEIAVGSSLSFGAKDWSPVYNPVNHVVAGFYKQVL
jgi:hypothetical protein